MISPRTFILAVLILLIAPILSAPIYLHTGGSTSVHVHSLRSSLGRDSPMLAVNARRNPSPASEGSIAARSFIDGELETNSLYELAKKTRHENKKLISRSFWSKITNTVKKVGSSVARGVSNVAKKVGGAVQNAAKKVGGAVQNTAKKVGGAVKNTAKKVGGAVKNTVNKVGGAVKNTVKKVGGAIQNTAKKVGGAVKNVAKKVTTAVKKTVNFVKANGAKIAKVGLKAVAAATKIASHAAVFIPGIGKPVGKVLSTISQVSDFASSKIPAKLSRTLEKGMDIMEKVEHPLGTGAAGQILDAVLKRDMEEESLVKRDTIEGELFYERDMPEFEVRSFDAEDIEQRSFDDSYELEARSFDDGLELEARSWDFEDEE